MICDFCFTVNGEHNARCPNYTPPKTRHYCSICNIGIQNGEEYIVNDNKEYAHWECINYTKDLMDFYGYRIEEMEDSEY